MSTLDNDDNKIKGFTIIKNVNPPAKIFGLYYNTFFVFAVIGGLLILLGSTRGWIGLILSSLVAFIIYIILFYLQTFYGPKKVAKMKNYFLIPINHLKIRKTFKRTY